MKTQNRFLNRIFKTLLIFIGLCLSLALTSKTGFAQLPKDCPDDPVSCSDCSTCASQTACQGCGVYICASTSIPSCMTSCDCSGAVHCRFYSIRNLLTCDAAIDKITIKIKRYDSNTPKWLVCKPVKNFGSCFTSEWNMTPTAPLSGTVDNCNNWPGGYTACAEETITFTPPAGTISGCGTVCLPDNTTRPNNNYMISRGDEFSFVLCGADDGTHCTDDGSDGDVAGIDLNIEYIDFNTSNVWNTWYTGITTSSDCLHTCP